MVYNVVDVKLVVNDGNSSGLNSFGRGILIEFLSIRAICISSGSKSRSGAPAG